MDINDLHELCRALANRLQDTPIEEEIKAIVEDLEWAKKKVYIRKPAGKERLAEIGRAALAFKTTLDATDSWNPTFEDAFDELDDQVRRLRIDIARDTQTAT